MVVQVVAQVAARVGTAAAQTARAGGQATARIGGRVAQVAGRGAAKASQGGARAASRGASGAKNAAGRTAQRGPKGRGNTGRPPNRSGRNPSKRADPKKSTQQGKQAQDPKEPLKKDAKGLRGQLEKAKPNVKARAKRNAKRRVRRQARELRDQLKSNDDKKKDPSILQGDGITRAAGRLARQTPRKALRFAKSRIKRLFVSKDGEKLLKRSKKARKRAVKLMVFVAMLVFLIAVSPIILVMFMLGGTPDPVELQRMAAASLLAGNLPPELIPAVAQAADVPEIAIAAYASAGTQFQVDWTMLAGIGKAECDHGRSTAAHCSKPYDVWRTDECTTAPRSIPVCGAGERGPMQHLGDLWRQGIPGSTKEQKNNPRVDGDPTPEGQDEGGTYIATDGDDDTLADPWNWFDATHGAARKLNAYKTQLQAKGAEYATVEFWIGSYNAGVAGTTKHGAAAGPSNADYVKTVTDEMTRIRTALDSLGLGVFGSGGGYGLCPIAGKTNFTNTWGAPRSQGSHEGVDMFADAGTPVIAPEKGTVEHSSNTLGGKVYRLTADSGMYYYGAHLSAYGKAGKVEAGDVIGYVGTTGDAKNTPPHLHWQVHPGGRGSAPVDPTPYADKLCGKNGANTKGLKGNGRPTDGPKGKVNVVDVRAPNGSTITVNVIIEAPLQRLLEDAEADGVKLSGGGYRSNASQIRLRRAHCGSSQYDIYEKPSSSCSPPTARPGRSMHEQGLAIDFNSCNTRSTKCYKWLAKHAKEYGFKNLPSEPWHWSTNGN